MRVSGCRGLGLGVKEIKFSVRVSFGQQVLRSRRSFTSLLHKKKGFQGLGFSGFKVYRY